MNWAQHLDEQGFAIVNGVIPPQDMATLLEMLPPAADKRGGVRNLLSVPAMHKLATSDALTQWIKPILGESARPVRGILFDKTPAANWKVPWHQDVTIAVCKQLASEGFGPWSVKDGVLHVQPPTSIMEKMLSLRLHVDSCPAENGALRVISRTHKRGKVSARDVESTAAESIETICEVEAGGVLLMRPLLFHASSASSSPAHRRVLHFDYAAFELPSGLQWFDGSVS